jgi:dephospho-CoA kinase
MATDLTGCVIVTGMPGAGKSTVTARAAARLPKAAQVRGDDMNLMIKSGYVGWMGMAREFGDGGWWFDTAALTADETARQLVAEAAERAAPLVAGWHAWLRRLHDV